MKIPLLSYKAITIPTGKSAVHNVTGQMFMCTESTARFEMSVDDGERVPMELGLGFRTASSFGRLTFFNDTAADIDVQYYVGAEEIKDARLNTLLERSILVGLKIPPTRIVAGATTIGSLATLTYVGVNAGDQRKQIVITNRDDTLDLTVQDSGGNAIATVFARTAWTVETNATIKLYNGNGTSLAINVAEFYYE